MQIHPIAHFKSPLKEKFGIPRQSLLAENLIGQIVFTPEYNSPDALRGLEGFDYLWIIWGFSANKDAQKHMTVRPPRLGGNRRAGVFATRSPFRPNNLGLSSVRIVSIETENPQGTLINVAGADLMNGTPIYDIKPYLAFTDSHPTAKGGFTDCNEWDLLTVETDCNPPLDMTIDERKALENVLSQNPRPQYHNDPTRVYGMVFGKWNISFTIDGNYLRITRFDELKSSRLL